MARRVVMAVAALSIVLAACGASVAPTPNIVYVTPAPTATVVALASPMPTATAEPTATPKPLGWKLALASCTFELSTDKDCRMFPQGDYHITDAPTVGGKVNLSVKVKNTGTKTSPPVTLVFDTAANDSWDEPDLGVFFPIAGCNGCRYSLGENRASYAFEWPGIPAGKTKTFTASFTANPAPGWGYHKMHFALYAGTRTQVAAGGSAVTRIGDWPLQIVVFPK